jgi:hypothetical protein
MIENIRITINGQEKDFGSDFDASMEFIAAAARAKIQAEKKGKAVKDLKAGDRFVYGGIAWVKLDDAHGGALVLAVNKQADAAFDKNESNNWATSSLRKDLNAYKNGYFTWAVLKDVNKADLIEFERDLTTDDGMTEYGTCKDFVSLYTCNEYRKYRKLIPECGAWHWTITADSLVYSPYVRFVYSGGSLGSYYAYRGSNGVRPLCVLKSNVEVEVEE